MSIANELPRGKTSAFFDLTRRFRKIGRKTRKNILVFSKIGLLRTRSWLGNKSQAEESLFRLGNLIRYESKARPRRFAYSGIDSLITRSGSKTIGECLDNQTPERFVLFIGYSRSGHSLVGSLLDAHPEAIISHELHVLRLLNAGASYKEILRSIKYNSFFFEYFGRGYSGYDYRVAGYYQGTYTKLKVAGDKKANQTTKTLRKNPQLWDRLINNWPTPIHFVHVIRNPLDNIATKSLRTKKDLAESTENYFLNASFINKLQKSYPEYITNFYLDDLIAKPEATLKELLETIGLTPDSNYLKACGDVVAKKPSQTRYKVDWHANVTNRIFKEIENHSFLHRYSGTSL